MMTILHGIPSLKLTVRPKKMDGWNTSLSYWGPGLFSGAFAVSFREGRVSLEMKLCHYLHEVVSLPAQLSEFCD